MSQMKERTEQCVFRIASWGALCNITLLALRGSKRMPGFQGYLDDARNISAKLIQWLFLSSGSSIEYLLPKGWYELYGNMRPRTIIDYIEKLGPILSDPVSRVDADSGKQAIDIVAMFTKLRHAVARAITASAAGLQLAFVGGNAELVDILKSKVLWDLCVLDLLLQVNLQHIFHENSYMVIPDDDDLDEIALSDIDFDNLGAMWAGLTPPLLFFPNDEGERFREGPYPSLGGSIYRTDSDEGPRLLEELVTKAIARVVY